MNGNNLNKKELEDVLKNVRKSYRLLYEYQRRVMDSVRYIANQYGYTNNPASHYWFSGNPPKNSKDLNLVSWSWDWLGMYFHGFHFGEREINNEQIRFSIVIQSDTGYYDTNVDKDITKLDIAKFKDAEDAKTRLIFWADTKNKANTHWGELKNGEHNFSKDKTEWKLKDDKNNTLAIAYNLEDFIDEKSTEEKIADFSEKCKSVGIPIKEDEEK